MTVLFAVNGWHYLFSIPLSILCLFLTLLILVQRGRGGGLTGALGGMGGQSAFGTKAGDVFTRITIIVAAIWIFLSMAAVKVLTQQASTGGLRSSERAAPLDPDAKGATGIGAAAPGDEAGQDAGADNAAAPEAPASDAAAPATEGASAPAPADTKADAPADDGK